MLKIGLTGGIGCGKTTVTKIFTQKGIPIIDADKIAKTLVQPKKAAFNRIKKTFGKAVIQTNGELNRNYLKQLIFNNQQKRQQLENILHPLIRKQIKQKIQIHQYKQIFPYIIIDVPLLLEKNYQALFDRILVVDCTQKQQLKRVQTRDQLASQMIEKIMHSQINRQRRLKQANDILDNTRSIENLQHQVHILHSHYEKLNERET